MLLHTTAVSEQNRVKDCATTRASKRNGGKADTNTLAVAQPEDRLVRVSEFARTLGVSESTFYRMLKAGAIPQPINIGLASKKINVWALSTVNDCIRKLKETAAAEYQ